jgi:hypothetical protein
MSVACIRTHALKNFKNEKWKMGLSKQSQKRIWKIKQVA